MTKMLVRFVYKKCDLLLMPFPELKELFIKNGIHTKSKVVLLGTDTAYFKPTQNKEEAKSKLGIKKDTFVIGFVGRLAREKNILTLYRAFRIIEKKHENIRLLIVGKGIKDLENEFRSDRNIIMAGATDNVLPYLQAMDIYVLPSLTETTSLSTVEAMACGIPVVTTPVGYVKYYVIEKHNGMLFPFRNSLVLSLKLDQLLRNHELRERLGKHARETAVKRFSLDKMTREIAEILEKY
jgi:glycosyltransferase involved in cell wall biosynthesis